MSTSEPTTGSITWHEVGDGVGQLAGPDGQALARYSWTRANHPYLDDLRPLGHAGVLTAHAPHDHRWHHGLWFTWKFLNDVLFWEDHPGYGGNRTGLGRSVVTSHRVEEVPTGVAVVEELDWRVDATGEVLLREERTTAATLDTGLDGAWALDVDSRWVATTDVVMAATPWPETAWGGYAGLNYRAARAMAAEERILAAGGREGQAAVHGERAGWAAYAGLVDGAETDEPDRPAHGGVALLQHPGDGVEAEEPSPIYAWSASDGFGFLATAPLMRADAQLAAGQQLRSRTRALVLGAALDAAQLDAAHATYAASAPSLAPA